MDDLKMMFESYTLILKHSYWDGHKEHLIDDPIAVKCCIESMGNNEIYILNEMINNVEKLAKRRNNRTCYLMSYKHYIRLNFSKQPFFTK